MAQAVLDAIRMKVARGADPQSAVDEFAPVHSGRTSIAHWLAEYLERQAERCDAGGISPNTLYELRRCARAELSWWNGSSLSDIDALSLDNFSRYLSKERKLGPKTVRNTLGIFRAFLRWLARMERIERVPEFPVVRAIDYMPTIISQRTQALILAEIPHDLRGAFLAACHGVRPGEVRALDVTDVHERNDVPGLLVRKAVKGPNAGAPIRGTKTGDASWIPIDEELAEWIEWRLG
jgi:integrase